MTPTLETLASPPVLRRALDAVTARQGIAGTDGETVAAMQGREAEVLADLSRELLSLTYRARPVLRVPVQEEGKVRELAVPTVRDRIVQRALADLLQPCVEPLLCDAAWAFRPGRGARDAAARVLERVQAGATHVLVADIQRFFDSIPHGPLVAALGRLVPDVRLLDLVRDLVRCQVLDHMALQDSPLGIPQGSPLSPLLSNLYLASFDAQMQAQGFPLVRYCDDFVIPCGTAVGADAAWQAGRRHLEVLGLALHPRKTGIHTIQQGFVFLGFQFGPDGMGPSRGARTALLQRLREGARQGMGIDDHDAVVRGWEQYFGPVPPDLRDAVQALRPKADVTLSISACAMDDPVGGLLDLFTGREDRFAEEQVDPAGTRRFVTIHRPMGCEDVRDHLAGRRTLALMLQRANGSVRMAVLDVDVSAPRMRGRVEPDPSDLLKADDYARRVCGQAAQRAIPVLLEDSGCKGRHLWFPFRQAVPSAQARRLLMGLLQSVGEPPEGIRCEVFPDRDRPPGPRDGRVVKLPLGIHGLSGRRCPLLDPGTGHVLPDPLKSIHELVPLEASAVRALLGGLPDRPASGVEAPWTDADAAPLAGFPVALRILAGCGVLRHLWRRVRATGYLDHQDRLCFLHALGTAGEESRTALHRIMSFTFNYDPRVTERWWKRRRKWPVSCVRIRELYPALSTQVGCDCAFRLPRNGYPSPFLHGLGARDPFPVRGGEGLALLAGAEAGRRAQVEELVRRIRDLRRNREGLDRQLQKALEQLQEVVSGTTEGGIPVKGGWLTWCGGEEGFRIDGGLEPGKEWRED